MLPKDGERVKLNEERIKHWLSNGAVPTDRVLRFLDEAGIAKRPTRSNPNKALPGKKAQERLDAAKQAEEDAKEAAAAAEAEAAAAAEAPAEEAAAEAPAEEVAAEAPAEEAPAAEEAAAEDEKKEEAAS